RDSVVTVGGERLGTDRPERGGGGGGGGGGEASQAMLRAAVPFTVRNPGPGISAPDRARLFTRFQQLDGSDGRSRGGTGLGLAICKAIVEQHGGRIGVDSEPGGGTTFWFELPFAPTRGEHTT